jgi:hypothetical protein
MTELAEGSARFAADLYSFVARQVINRFGKEGEGALRAGLRDFGLARGRALRELVEAKGGEVNLTNFIENYNLPMARAWQGKREVGATRRFSRVIFCPLADQWRKRGGAELGQLYCSEVDPAIREGYSPRLKFRAEKYLLLGDAHCEQIDEMER